MESITTSSHQHLGQPTTTSSHQRLRQSTTTSSHQHLRQSTTTSSHQRLRSQQRHHLTDICDSQQRHHLTNICIMESTCNNNNKRRLSTVESVAKRMRADCQCNCQCSATYPRHSTPIVIDLTEPERDVKPCIQPSTSRASVSNVHHEPDVRSLYYWTRAPLSVLQQYYQYKGCYICPLCEVIVSTFEQFEAEHHNAPSFNEKKKVDLYSKLSKKRTVTADQTGAGAPSTSSVNADTAPETVQRSRARRTRQQPREQLFDFPDEFSVRVLSSLNSACVTIEFTPANLFASVYSFVDIYSAIMQEYVHRHTSNSIKIQLYINVEFRQAQDPNERSTLDHSTSAKSPEESQLTFRQFLLQKAQHLDQMLSEYNERSSGWVVNKIVKISLICSQYTQLCRIAGRSFIETPSFIRKKHAVINVRNPDDKCFLYSILAILKKDQVTRRRNRYTVYEPYLNDLKYNESDMPMRISNIPKFERSNPHLAINIIKYTPLPTNNRNSIAQVLNGSVAEDDENEDDDMESELEDAMFDDSAAVDDEDNESSMVSEILSEDDDDVDPTSNYLKHQCFDLVYRSRHYNTRNPNFDNVTIVNLLLISEGDNFHYLAVTNLNLLLNCHADVEGCPIQIRGHICLTCLRIFYKKSVLEMHKSTCLELMRTGTVYSLPEKKQLEFTEWNKTISPKFVIYADFESILVPNDDPTSKCPRGRILQTHKPIAAGLLKLNPDGTHDYEDFYGENCILEFLSRIELHAKQVKRWYDSNAHHEMRPLTHTQCIQYARTTHCYLCKSAFSDGLKKVRDHDHFNGDYLGAACSSCNLARRIKKPFLPIVFHNLRGYDMHLIIKEAVGSLKNWDLNCIPQSSEKFLSLLVYIKDCVSLRFIDSMQFLASSLAKLGDMLEPSQKVHLNSLDNVPAAARDGKGIFPYSYATSKAVLDESRDCLPPREEAFFDTLADTVKVTVEEYNRAQAIWRRTGCKSLKDYMMLYMKIDVYLLCDVFEAFRSTAMSEDSLDPANFFSIPGLSWCSALHMLPQKLDLLDDLEMYEFFEAGVRGGMTFVNRHYSCKSESSDLLYIDVNNLYGWALSQKLPCSNFTWINDQDTLNTILNNLPDESSDVGYLLEVDLHVPEDKHNKLSDLPPAPISARPPGSSVKKLLLTMSDKQKYKIHSALLKFYIENMGVLVTAVHRAVKFNQTTVFKDYIDYNTAKRAQSTSKFHKDYYKLKNNSLYGKTVENLRKRKDLRLCNRQDKFIVYTSKPNFKHAIQIDEELVAVVLTKEKICLNRPVYIGQAVLDLSKLRMYRLQYKDLQLYRDMWPHSQINILAGDTDSYFLETVNINLKSDLLPLMKQHGLLDTSNYPSSHPLHSKEFENKIGLVKDESAGVQKFTEWVFLRPKCYSLLCDDSEEVNKAKGVTKSTALTHAQYMDIYQSYDPTSDTEPEVLTVQQRNIISHVHQLYTVSYNKRALSVMDDKRNWIEQNYSLPYGHFAI